MSFPLDDWLKIDNITITNLSAMQFLTARIGLDNLSSTQTETIIYSLKVTYGFDTESLSNLIKEVSVESDHSSEYDDIILRMHLILSECIHCLTMKRKGYIKTVSRYIKAFHNYPRVFLSITDKSKISPSDSKEYAESYTKID